MSSAPFEEVLQGVQAAVKAEPFMGTRAELTKRVEGVQVHECKIVDKIYEAASAGTIFERF